MMASFEDLGPSLWLGLHAAAFLIACLTRLPLVNQLGLLLRIALPLCFLAVGYLTLLGSGGLEWIASGGTLGAMTLASVWDGNISSSNDPLLLRLLAAHEA